MKPRYNPFPIFRGSRTPAGLYARRKWLGESAELGWPDDFQKTVRSLLNGQSQDGSWHQSPLETIRRLFGLHLTVRNTTGEIEKALGWLIAVTLNDRSIREEPFETIASDAFRELPFTAGQTGVTLTCAALFLAAIFLRDDDPAVMGHYQNLALRICGNDREMVSWADRSNVLRAFLVHPRYVNDPATAILVDRLAEIQDSAGCWREPIHFFQTVNALAHLRTRAADLQWLKALPMLIETQNADGSWGDEDREWNTFLVVHALRNKGCL